ncbi:MAG: RrF2 family transcriptional regulator [Christensenellales bacterium]|jgi:Rrf2 family cysteine metabolism transcriptional repressor
MKVTTKARYGINAVFELVLHADESPLPLKVIAERQQIPEAYLEQLMMQLRRAGVVLSARGAFGGYSLAKPASEITVGEVIRTLEGSMAPVDCLLGDGDGCRDGRCCPGRIVWERIYDSVNHVMDSLTLEELAEEYMEQ